MAKLLKLYKGYPLTKPLKMVVLASPVVASLYLSGKDPVGIPDVPAERPYKMTINPSYSSLATTVSGTITLNKDTYVYRNPNKLV